MTYEEYKNKKSINLKNNKNLINNLLNKIWTVLIWSILIVIISNNSPRFKTFLIDKVLNSTFDFSYVNKIVNRFTDVFKKDIETLPVSKEIIKSEKYKDGIKYYIEDDNNVYLKDSGIVTYIGEKEGYNNTIIIQQSNGYYAWYGNIEKPSIKLYDYIEKGTQIGITSDEYYYVLLKDDKPVTINE